MKFLLLILSLTLSSLALAEDPDQLYYKVSDTSTVIATNAGCLDKVLAEDFPLQAVFTASTKVEFGCYSVNNDKGIITIQWWSGEKDDYPQDKFTVEKPHPEITL